MLRSYKISLAAVLYCLFSVLNVQAQDPIYSQFYAAPLQINPAFAGNTLAPRISFNYRNQWPSIDRAYITTSASYEQFLEAANSSIGLMFQSDNAGNGVYKTTNFLAAYGYRLQINRDLFLKIGVEAGINQNLVDWDQLVFLDQIDPIYGRNAPDGSPYLSQEERPLSLSKTYFDVGAGLLAYGKNFYAGASLKHLNTPDETLIEVNTNLNQGLPMRITAHAGGQFTITEGNNRQTGSFISPNVMFIKQGDFGQLNAGAYIGFGSLFSGVWYRHAFNNPDAAIFLFGVEYDVFRIGYSYDFTVSSLALANGGTGGSHEIGVTLNFENSADFKKRRRATRYNDCLKIFR